MINHFHNKYYEYPSQFWLMVVGLFISSAGASMIWPFLMIYVSEELRLSLSTVSTLITINAVTGLFASFVAGLVSDKVGRKLVMTFSLAINGISYLAMGQVHTYLGFALIMVLMGASNPLYQVGSDAMLADLLIPEKRTNGYSIIRMVNNAGIAIGPAIGGFIATKSYNYTFLSAAIGMLIYSLLLFSRAHETLNKESLPVYAKGSERLGGYNRVFRDFPYVVFALLIGIGLIAPSMLWTLFAVYTKQNFGLPENLYGWLPTTNALMCVFVQFSVTQVSSPASYRHRYVIVCSWCW
jgi:MFS family permease